MFAKGGFALDTMQKLSVLSDAAKYDVACTSSGTARKGVAGHIGDAYAAGICHSFSADGRCISLLKVLLSNVCSYDCRYCAVSSSSDVPRATFEPRELAGLTIEFYRRNYIEGLFLSSAVLGTPDRTMELLIKTLFILRHEYRFNGYIHAKAIPGADNVLVEKLGLLADRMSVNIELPSESSLKLLAPDKSRGGILGPMGFMRQQAEQNKKDIVVYRNAPKFVPAGQSTQMIIGASPETDRQIIKLSEGLYRKYSLKRVFFSAYLPVRHDEALPAVNTKPPLLREHRLYQADWLMRFYRFAADEILDDSNPNLSRFMDPKTAWAVRHREFFPVDVNRADYDVLLRVPGIGPYSAKRIVKARKSAMLDAYALKKLGVVMKRAQFFILCRGQTTGLKPPTKEHFLISLLSKRELDIYRQEERYGQMQMALW